MGTDNPTSEQDRKFSKKIEERDKRTPSPEARAKYILDLINDNNPNLTNWDIFCFCIEFLGAQALIYSWLDQECIFKITHMLYLAHYTRNDDPETGVKV